MRFVASAHQYGATVIVMERFDATPKPAAKLLGAAFDFNEAVVRRRRQSGAVAWNRNVGLAAPVTTSR